MAMSVLGKSHSYFLLVVVVVVSRNIKRKTLLTWSVFDFSLEYIIFQFVKGKNSLDLIIFGFIDAICDIRPEQNSYGKGNIFFFLYHITCHEFLVAKSIKTDNKKKII